MSQFISASNSAMIVPRPAPMIKISRNESEDGTGGSIREPKGRHGFSDFFRRRKTAEEVGSADENSSTTGTGLAPLQSFSGTDQRKVRTKIYRKPQRDFGNLRHVQVLDVPINAREDAPNSHGALWSVEINNEGGYMAAAGADKLIWVWSILYHHEGEQRGGQVFANKPIRIFEGHTDEIQKLAWSSNNFLISASLDGTAKLWHIERDQCLASFAHPDVVSSVVFHPTDDRFFITGCLDGKVRLWSIPDKEVSYEYTCPSPVSALAFGPKGGMLFAGCFNGLILIFMTDGLKLRKKLQVGSQNVVLNSTSLRVTGIIVFVDEDEAVSRVKMLVSSNGSRLRIYDLQTLSLDCKYRGFSNAYSQASAALSPDLHWVISPSDDRKTYIWALHDTNSAILTTSTKNVSFENFKSNKGTTTCALFAPESTKKLLGYTGDIIVTTDTEGEIGVYHNRVIHEESIVGHMFPKSLIRSLSMTRKHSYGRD